MGFLSETVKYWWLWLCPADLGSDVTFPRLVVASVSEVAGIVLEPRLLLTKSTEELLLALLRLRALSRSLLRLRIAMFLYNALRNFNRSLIYSQLLSHSKSSAGCVLRELYNAESDSNDDWMVLGWLKFLDILAFELPKSFMFLDGIKCRWSDSKVCLRDLGIPDCLYLKVTILCCSMMNIESSTTIATMGRVYCQRFKRGLLSLPDKFCCLN